MIIVMENNDWDTWRSLAKTLSTKLSMEKQQLYDKMLFDLCDAKNEGDVVVSYDMLSNDERKYLHERCSQLGLLHESVLMGNFDESYSKTFIVTKRKEWKWNTPFEIPVKMHKCSVCKFFCVKSTDEYMSKLICTKCLSKSTVGQNNQ